MTDSYISISTKENCSELLQEIKIAKNALGKTAMQYWLLKRFDIIEIGCNVAYKWHIQKAIESYRIRRPSSSPRMRREAAR